MTEDTPNYVYQIERVARLYEQAAEILSEMYDGTLKEIERLSTFYSTTEQESGSNGYEDK